MCYCILLYECMSMGSLELTNCIHFFNRSMTMKQTQNPKSKQWILIDTKRGLIKEYSKEKFK